MYTTDPNNPNNPCVIRLIELNDAPPFFAQKLPPPAAESTLDLTDVDMTMIDANNIYKPPPPGPSLTEPFQNTPSLSIITHNNNNNNNNSRVSNSLNPSSSSSPGPSNGGSATTGTASLSSSSSPQNRHLNMDLDNSANTLLSNGPTTNLHSSASYSTVKNPRIYNNHDTLPLNRHGFGNLGSNGPISTASNNTNQSSHVNDHVNNNNKNNNSMIAAPKARRVSKRGKGGSSKSKQGKGKGHAQKAIEKLDISLDLELDI